MGERVSRGDSRQAKSAAKGESGLDECTSLFVGSVYWHVYANHTSIANPRARSAAANRLQRRTGRNTCYKLQAPIPPVMTMSLFCRVAIVLMSVCSASGVLGECNSLDQINWIAGNWQSATERSITSETWNKISEDTWEGSGAVHDNATGELRSAESLRMVAMSGEVFYIAKVGHNPVPIAFKLVECGPTSATFSNPGHDFPKQLDYFLNESGALRVRVSDGGDRGFEIHFEAAP